jgi:hypothetical protein
MSHKYIWNGRDPYDSPYTYQPDSSFYIPAYRGSSNSAPTQATNYTATPGKYGNDDASDPGYNDYPGPPCPEPHKEQARRAAEYGLTPQELHEISQDCIHEQEILEQEYQEEMREAREAREETMRTIGELKELKYEQRERLANQTQVGTHLSVYNHKQGPPWDWAVDQEELPPRMPTPTTFYEPEYDAYEVYEAYGTADEPPEAATSPNDDAWPVTVTPPLDREQVPYGHETPPPSWEYTTATNPGYDDETSAHGLVHTVYHAVEHQVDDTMLFGHEHPSLWHEMQAADEDWAAAYKGGPDLQEEGLTGVYLHPNYSPPPSPTPCWHPQPLPTPWYPPQPPKLSYNPHIQPQPPHSRYQGNRPRAPRHECGYRPRHTTSMPRERYHRPRLTIGDIYGKRGLRIPLSQPD